MECGVLVRVNFIEQS